MTHFFTVVLVPQDSTDVQAAVSALLAPYNENMDVEPYKKYKTQEDVDRMADHYKTHALDELALHMEEWSNNDGGVDGLGLFELSTYNPQSQWDYWSMIEFEINDDGKLRNAFPVSEVQGDFQCFAVVTPNGTWHQRAEAGWWGMTTNEKDRYAWQQEIKALFQANQNCLLVGVDCHI